MEVYAHFRVLPYRECLMWVQSAADRHQLTTLSSFIQDAILGIVALVHVFVLTRATTAGMAGPLVRPPPADVAPAHVICAHPRDHRWHGRAPGAAHPADVAPAHVPVRTRCIDTEGPCSSRIILRRRALPGAPGCGC